MNDLLNQFCKWAGMTPSDYAREGMDQCRGPEECDFSDFASLIDYAKKIVKQNILSNEYIDDLLTIMALDNEAENVLDYIESNSSREQIARIICVGSTHLQPHARWQIAELICRKNTSANMAYLLLLAEDAHPYVKKRARNCLIRLNTG